MERDLTQFQIRCEERLNAILARNGITIAGRRLDGASETYITGDIAGRDITFWIYRDGANFHAGDGRRMFERPDYDSLDDLAVAFVEQLLEAAA